MKMHMCLCFLIISLPSFSFHAMHFMCLVGRGLFSWSIRMLSLVVVEEAASFRSLISSLPGMEWCAFEKQ